VHRSADPTNPIEFEVRSHEWAPLQAACGEAAKASDAASLRVGPCRCSYRRLTQRVLFESAAGRTGSCSAGYAVLIAFVRGASTSRKLEGILTGWLPIKTQPFQGLCAANLVTWRPVQRQGPGSV
jgi:hypothetical protein